MKLAGRITEGSTSIAITVEYDPTYRDIANIESVEIEAGGRVVDVTELFGGPLETELNKIIDRIDWSEAYQDHKMAQEEYQGEIWMEIERD